MTPEEIALQLKNLIIEVSPLIEEFTQKTCPYCKDVCCKQRHAIPEERDILYRKLLRLQPETFDNRDEDEPCQFLSNQGCIKPRWQRPLRCTWYFCDSLLKAIDEGNQKKARRLIEQIKSIVELSRLLTEGYYEKRLT